MIVAAARRDRDRLKALATDAVFRGVSRSRVDALALEHGRAIAAGGLRDDVVARLGWHLEQGHQVVIVSASYEPYVRVVAGSLGAADVVATRLAVDADDVCTGELDGANCRAEEKVRRLEQWLSSVGSPAPTSSCGRTGIRPETASCSPGRTIPSGSASPSIALRRRLPDPTRPTR